MSDHAAEPSRRPGPPAFPRVPGQGRLATRDQLTAAGWTRAAVQHASGRTIRAVHRGAYVDHLGPITDDDALVAAYLWAGRDHAVLTGLGALRRWNLVSSGSRELVFLVPATQRDRRGDGVRTVRSRRSVRLALKVRCVPMATCARALCDAARHQKLGGDTLRAATLAALQRELTTPTALARELADGKPHRLLTAVSTAVEQFTKGAWSLPEAALAGLVRDDPLLGTILFNPTLVTPDGQRIGTPDGYLEAAGVAVQVHSRKHHDRDEDGTDLWSPTVEKDSVYPAHGIVVVGVTPRSIARRPEVVLSRLRQVVEHAPHRDLSHVVVVPWRGRSS